MGDGKRAMTAAELAAIEEQFDPEARFRTVTRPVATLAG